MILVTGATGTVGRTLLDALHAVDAPVRAMTRRPNTARLPAWADVVPGDLGDPRSLKDALLGVDRVFLLSAGPDGPTHDHNLASAAADANVDHIVKLSALSAGQDEDDGQRKADDPITAWHRAGEQAIRSSGVPFTFLRPNAFMSNALTWAGTIANHDTVYHPYAAGRFALIDPRDIAAAAATVLTQPGHHGRAYPLAGPEALTPEDQVTILAGALGRPLRYVELSPPAARQAMTGSGMPPEIADAVLAMLATSLQPGAAVTASTLTQLISTPPRTFSTWAHDHASLFAPRYQGDCS